ncbi:MAG: hypothetical protein Q9223_001346 [Gallowayella weberi]
MKANDRKRMAQRDVYKQFVEDFMPKRKSTKIQSSEDATKPSREEVFAKALETFGKRVESEIRVREWRKEQEELGRKHGTREWKKEQAMKAIAYTDAWIKFLELTTKEVCPKSNKRAG